MAIRAMWEEIRSHTRKATKFNYVARNLLTAYSIQVGACSDAEAFLRQLVVCGRGARRKDEGRVRATLFVFLFAMTQLGIPFHFDSLSMVFVYLQHV